MSVALRLEGLKLALTTVAAHLKQRSATAHKERVDLAALQAHSGERYVQVEAVPNKLYSRLRELHGVRPLVLLPHQGVPEGRGWRGSR